MKIGPKYKIAKRLGAKIFEKTQTQKYALRAERKGARTSRPKSEYGVQFNEKQKTRFTYGVTEKQFANYVREALLKTSNTSETIFEFLERRLDNALYRLGIAPTRLAARQMVSHGHILVNGRKTLIPSRRLYKNDVIEIRGGSINKTLFANLEEKVRRVATPAWLTFDIGKKKAEVVGEPRWSPAEHMFDLNAVVEFYSR